MLLQTCKQEAENNYVTPNKENIGGLHAPPPQDPLGVLDRRGTRTRVQNTWPGTQQKKHYITNKTEQYFLSIVQILRFGNPFKYLVNRKEKKKGHKGAKLHNKRLVVELHIITQIIHSLVPKGSQPPGDLVGGNRL